MGGSGVCTNVTEERSSSGTLWGAMADSSETTPPVFVSLAHAAKYLGISERNAYRLAENGELPGAIKVGRSWRVRLEVLESLGRREPPPE
jgi:excisionase family DNA binding protein